MSTLETIRPILRSTYGRNAMTDALAEHLAPKIDRFAPRYPDETREDLIMRICWDWMTGGSTAKKVAEWIDEAVA